MDTTPQMQPTADANPVPPTESHASTILNGAGNGMMIGGLPIAAAELWYALVKDVDVPRPLVKVGLCLAAAGAAIGMVIGEKEAKRLAEYRRGLHDEIAALRHETQETSAKVAAQDETIRQWAEKMANDNAPAPAIASR